MRKSFTLEYWRDDDWYVGRLKEVPGVFSQGETLEELEANIRDAYGTVLSEQPPIPTPREAQSKEIAIEVASRAALASRGSKALEEQQRQGYQRHPVEPSEVEAWEKEQIWPD